MCHKQESEVVKERRPDRQEEGKQGGKSCQALCGRGSAIRSQSLMGAGPSPVAESVTGVDSSRGLDITLLQVTLSVLLVSCSFEYDRY
jgi:hypothetical protein